MVRIREVVARALINIADTLAPSPKPPQKLTTSPSERLAESLVRTVESGYTRIPSVAVSRNALIILDKQISLRNACISVAFSAFWPTLINGPLFLINSDLSITTLRGFGISVLSGACCLAMISFAWLAWRALSRSASAIADFFGHDADIERIQCWLDRRLTKRRQLIAPGIGALCGVMLIYHISLQQGIDFEVKPSTYLMAAWVGFLGGNVGYWIITMAELPMRLSRCRDKRLEWIDPGNTPIIVKLCGGYALSALGVGIGVLLAEAVALTVPRNTGSLVLNGLIYVFPVIAVLVALYIGVQPYITLYFLVRKFRNGVLREYVSKIPSPVDMPETPLDHQAVIEVYKHLSSMQCLPIQPATVVQYSAAIVGSLIAYLLQSIKF